MAQNEAISCIEYEISFSYYLLDGVKVSGAGVFRIIKFVRERFIFHEGFLPNSTNFFNCGDDFFVEIKFFFFFFSVIVVIGRERFDFTIYIYTRIDSLYY